MKKIIFAIALLVGFNVTSFAGEKDVDTKLLNDLAATFKRSVQVHWTSEDTYSKATFEFKEKTASAFYDAGTLLGFGVQFDKADLPDVVSQAITSKYGDWKLTGAMIFVDPDGYINYYVQVQKNNKALALRITPNGNLSIYSKYAPDKRIMQQ